jgi:hypothetical protein
MKLLYVLAALPLLALAAPAPVPSYYQKRVSNPELAKRQLTVAQLKQRAEESEDHKHHYKPSGYYAPR